LKGFSEIKALSVRKGDFLAIDGAVEGLGGLLADPTAGDQTLENGGHV
jgi:hypothetical protein